MEMNKTIPIVVGVTAHRRIREEDRPALYAAVRSELEKLEAICPNSPLVMLNSLAEGGDLLCADAAEELGIPVIAVLPDERKIYEKDFSAEGKERFAHHCARARQVLVAPFTETVPGDGPNRSFRFRQAGIYVSSHSHVLLALWDGGEGTEDACGTAEAVDFTLHGNYRPDRGMSVRSASNEAVIHIFTPRGEHTQEPAGTIHVLGKRQAVLEGLRQTDEFNRLAAALPEQKRRLVPKEETADPILEQMEQVYLAASALSGTAAKLYRKILAALAVCATVLTMAFLLYDEARALWMILICGAVLLTAFYLMHYAHRSDCHRQYLEYRALAECLRVQVFLRYAGSDIQAVELLSWTQQEETAWVMDALCVLTIGNRAGETHDISDCWVEKQRAYHRRAARRVLRDSAISERMVRIAMLVSIVLYLLAVVFEIVYGGLIFTPARQIPAEHYRTVLKVILGSLSALTLFAANYFGRLSLSRRCSDHSKMERFFLKIAMQLQQHGQTDELLTVLAREELIENGNWCSYQRDNTPDLSL